MVYQIIGITLSAIAAAAAKVAAEKTVEKVRLHIGTFIARRRKGTKAKDPVSTIVPAQSEKSMEEGVGGELREVYQVLCAAPDPERIEDEERYEVDVLGAMCGWECNASASESGFTVTSSASLSLTIWIFINLTTHGVSSPNAETLRKCRGVAELYDISFNYIFSVRDKDRRKLSQFLKAYDFAKRIYVVKDPSRLSSEWRRQNVVIIQPRALAFIHERNDLAQFCFYQKFDSAKAVESLSRRLKTIRDQSTEWKVNSVKSIRPKKPSQRAGGCKR
jgi:hypothetical protein